VQGRGMGQRRQQREKEDGFHPGNGTGVV